MKYTECSGGGHIIVTEDDGSVQTFDKREFFPETKPQEVRTRIYEAIVAVSPDADVKEAVDWIAVKGELEKK